MSVTEEELDRLRREADEEQRTRSGVAALIRYSAAVMALMDEIVYE